MISDQGQFYSVEVIHSRKGKNTVRTEYRDSMKKLNFSVHDIAEAYEIEEKKGVIDYNAVRPIGYEPTLEEWEYVFNDVIIVAKALQILFDRGLTRMTQSSDGLYFCQKLLSKPVWDEYFPILDIETDDRIRKAYRGGVVMVHPDREGKEVGAGASYDANSMYPWAMCKTMPCGVPLEFTGKYKNDELYPLYIQELSCEFEVKPGYIPTIQLKNNPNYISTEYITRSEDQVHLSLSSIDLELFFKHYNVYNIRYEGGLKFKAVDDIFKSYVDYWYEIKRTGNKSMRSVAKLMLNAFYGKTASRTRIKGKYPYIGEDEIVHYGQLQEKIKEPVYTAVAVFITSYARQNVITTAQRFGGTSADSHFCYMDTDSVHVIGISEDEVKKIINVHPSDLGAWKKEYEFVRAKYIRQKCYIEERQYKAGTKEYDSYMRQHGISGLEQEIEIISDYVKKAAGMSQSIKDVISYDEFEIGYSIDELKLQPKQVKGGVILKGVPYKIKPK